MAAKSVTVLEAKLPLHPSQPTEVVFPRRPFGKTKVVYCSFGLVSGSGYTMMLQVTWHIVLSA